MWGHSRPPGCCAIGGIVQQMDATPSIDPGKQHKSGRHSGGPRGLGVNGPHAIPWLREYALGGGDRHPAIAPALGR